MSGINTRNFGFSMGLLDMDELKTLALCSLIASFVVNSPASLQSTMNTYAMQNVVYDIHLVN